jgi:hypothetical protein
MSGRRHGSSNSSRLTPTGSRQGEVPRSDTTNYRVGKIKEWDLERTPQMHALPPVANPLAPRISRPWLPPIRFRAKAYIKLCLAFDKALRDLESQYPSRPILLTIEDRQKRLKKRRPK